MRSREPKILRSDDVVAALLVAFAAVLFFGVAGWLLFLGFGLISAVLLGSLTFFLLGVFFALTAPIWALALSLIYVLLIVVLTPFYSLYTAFRQTHKAS